MLSCNFLQSFTRVFKFSILFFFFSAKKKQKRLYKKAPKVSFPYADRELTSVPDGLSSPGHDVSNDKSWIYCSTSFLDKNDKTFWHALNPGGAQI